MFRRAHFLVSLCALFAGVACKKAPEPQNKLGPSMIPTVSAASHSVAAPAPGAGAAAQVTWTDPAEWKRSERVSPMRKATYVIPRAGGDAEDGELGVFYFGPGQGGGVDANVDRWVKQFPDAKLQDVKRADRTANGLLTHTVEIESASFSAGMMGMGSKDAKSKPNYGLLGAIVEAPSGSYFFKLTGPKATVAAAKPVFYRLLDSVHTTG